jgi:hypothetical protein
MSPTTKLWVKRIAIVFLAILGTFTFFALPFAWNLFVFALLLSIAFVFGIVLTVQNKTWAEATVMAVPVVFALGTFIGNSTNFAKSVGWIKPTYGVSINPSAITLNKVAQVKLIASYADGTTPSLDGYRCHWKFDRSPPAAPTDEQCAIDIQDTSDLFKGKDLISVDLGINVEPIPPGSRDPVQVDHTRDYTLRMYNYSTR